MTQIKVLLLMIIILIKIPVVIIKDIMTRLESILLLCIDNIGKY